MALNSKEFCFFLRIHQPYSRSSSNIILARTQGCSQYCLIRNNKMTYWRDGNNTCAYSKFLDMTI